MGKDILLVVDAVAHEKGVSKSVIFDALESAIATATKKRIKDDVDIRVAIDRKTGNYETFRRWEVVDQPEEDVDEVEFPDRQILCAEAQLKQPDINVGDYVENIIESIPFGRIAAQTGKQVIVQKVREAERAKLVQEYESRKGELVTGIVKKVERGSIYIDLGSNAEAVIGKDDAITRDPLRMGDRVRGYLYDVRSEPRGSQLFVSRVAPELLIELFKLEVPEVSDGIIQIMGAARDPGVRAKVSVKTNDKRIDPVGACVGMRGSRVLAVSNELAGERIDIVLWDENHAQYVINAMSPAEVVSIVVDEDEHTMDVAVKEGNLSLAIGKAGQNVRLASELTGWVINVMTESQAEAKVELETDKLTSLFKDELGVDEEVAVILVQEGFSSIDEIAYIPAEEMFEIEEFDEGIVNELRSRSKDVLLTRAIAKDTDSGTQPQPADDLLNMDGMDAELAATLAAHEIITMEDLAEQAVDELLEIEDIGADRAAKLIMTARAPWFTDEQKD